MVYEGKMRRKEREITDRAKIIEMIAECDVCRIGLVDEKGAYIVPMNFGFDEKDGLTFYFHCAAEGKKLNLLKKVPYASFEMDYRHKLISSEKACSYSFNYSCVMGYGEVVFLNGCEKLDALDKIMSHYGVENREYSESALGRVIVFALRVLEISAKAN